MSATIVYNKIENAKKVFFSQFNFQAKHYYLFQDCKYRKWKNNPKEENNMVISVSIPKYILLHLIIYDLKNQSQHGKTEIQLIPSL